MTADAEFEKINEAKANMDHIYDQSDPRAYFRELKKLGYGIPGAAKPIFQKLISHLRHRPNDTVHVLDLGCSYGVNAALLKHGDGLFGNLVGNQNRGHGNLMRRWRGWRGGRRGRCRGCR